MDMTPARWAATAAYLDDVFGREDAHLTTLMDRAIAAGIPSLSVSASVGRLLQLTTTLTGGVRALEVGALAGYSGIWIARGLAPGGRLITLEPEGRAVEWELPSGRRLRESEPGLVPAGKGALDLGDEDLFGCLQLAKELGVIVTAHCENAAAIDAMQARLLSEGKTGPEHHEPSRPTCVEADGVGVTAAGA